MGGRIHGAFFAAALLQVAASLAACATAGDGGSVDGGEPSLDAPAPRDGGLAREDATTRPNDAGDGALGDDGDAAVTPGSPETSDFGTAPQDSGAAGDDDAGGDNVLDAQAPGDGSADGAIDGGAIVAASGDAAITDASTPDGAASDAAAEGGEDAGACGACATGFACGSSHYCRTATGVPAFGRVFVIVLDDQPLSVIKGSASAPYLNQLMTTYAYGTNYTTPDHPSLPNYFELTSGNPQGNLCDCQPGPTSTCNAGNCNLLASSCACPVGVSHLGDDLDVAGIAWREYAESMGAPCNPTGIDGGTLFAANHVPFLYYDDVFMNAGRCQQRVRDFGDFAGDVSGASGVAVRFALVSPNLCNDMHSNCSGDPVKQGDLWLAAQVPLLLATPGFAAGGSDVLFIVGDELPAALGTGPMPFIVVSPLAKAGATTPGAYDHYSLLATLEDGLGLPRLGNAEASATIADVWR
jgi:phosphatidylinositol-3-phosphatase